MALQKQMENQLNVGLPDNPPKKQQPKKSWQNQPKQKWVSQQQMQTLPNDSDLPKTIESQEEAVQICNALIKREMVPASFKTPESVFMALQVCRAFGVVQFGHVLTTIQNMYIVNGSIHMFGDLPLSLVAGSGELEYIREFFVDKDCKEICSENKNLFNKAEAAICEVKRKGAIRQEFSVTRDDLILSGGTPREDGGWDFVKGRDRNGNPYFSDTWRKYPKTHWRYRARTKALRSVFADVLKNITIAPHRPDNLSREQAEGPDSSILEHYSSPKALTEKSDKDIQKENQHQKEV